MPFSRTPVQLQGITALQAVSNYTTMWCANNLPMVAWPKNETDEIWLQPAPRNLGDKFNKEANSQPGHTKCWLDDLKMASLRTDRKHLLLVLLKHELNHEQVYLSLHWPDIDQRLVASSREYVVISDKTQSTSLWTAATIWHDRCASERVPHTDTP